MQAEQKRLPGNSVLNRMEEPVEEGRMEARSGLPIS